MVVLSEVIEVVLTQVMISPMSWLVLPVPHFSMYTNRIILVLTIWWPFRGRGTYWHSHNQGHSLWGHCKEKEGKYFKMSSTDFLRQLLLQKQNFIDFHFLPFLHQRAGLISLKGQVHNKVQPSWWLDKKLFVQSDHENSWLKIYTISDQDFESEIINFLQEFHTSAKFIKGLQIEPNFLNSSQNHDS
jgi:hypothetical protein